MMEAATCRDRRRDNHRAESLAALGEFPTYSDACPDKIAPRYPPKPSSAAGWPALEHRV